MNAKLTGVKTLPPTVGDAVVGARVDGANVGNLVGFDVGMICRQLRKG